MPDDDLIEDIDAPKDDAPEADTVAPETPDTPDAPEWDDETAAEAKLLGWKSPDEWKGDKPPGYIDNPNDFLERIEKSTPYRKIREQRDADRAEYQKSLAGIQAAIEAGHKREQERMRADYDAKIKEITKQQREAAQEGDLERYDALQGTKDSIKPPEPVRPADSGAGQSQEDPLKPFYETNSWVKDPIMRDAGAKVIDAAVRAGGLSPTSTVAEQIAYAEKQVRDYFPHKFEAPAPKRTTPRVDSGGLAGTALKREGFDALPKDARDAFQQQVKAGIFEDTKEDRKFYHDSYTNG